MSEASNTADQSIGDSIGDAAKAAADNVTSLAERSGKSARVAIEPARGWAGENIGLSLVGALALGAIVAALIPGPKTRKPVKQARKLADKLGDLGQSLAAEALDRVGHAASDSRDVLGDLSRSIGETIQEHSAEWIKQAQRIADDAAQRLHDGGTLLSRKAGEIADKTRS